MVTVTAVGLSANEGVSVTWDNSSQVAATGTTDASGTVSISLRAPHEHGTHTIAVEGESSRLEARANYYVNQEPEGDAGQWRAW